MPELKAVIIGAGIAGIAGLCCARTLAYRGLKPVVLEASDAIGGRVRTDLVDGFRLDRGFQVYLSAYPEGARFLDLKALGLRRFEPGAFIHLPGQQKLVSIHDVARKPSRLVATVRSPAATVSDLLRTAKLTASLRTTPIDEILSHRQMTTLERLRHAGFTQRMIDSFFKPFFGGVFLDNTLSASSRAFDFTFRMFASGYATIPAKGMSQIPDQLASRLPADCIRLRTTVATIANRLLVTKDGESILADAIVIATDGSAAAHLAPDHLRPPSAWTGTTCLAFATDDRRLHEQLRGRAIILLCAGGEGPINTIVPISSVSPDYAPAGHQLFYVNLIGTDHGTDAAIEQRVRVQLAQVLGNSTSAWRLLRILRVPHSLPDQSIAAMSEVHRRVRLRQGLYVCGDHVDQASINGAMCAGRRAGEVILRDFGLATDPVEA